MTAKATFMRKLKKRLSSLPPYKRAFFMKMVDNMSDEDRKKLEEKIFPKKKKDGASK